MWRLFGRKQSEPRTYYVEPDKPWPRFTGTSSVDDNGDYGDRRFMAVDLTKELNVEHLKQYFDWLGKPVVDRVRGVKGIATSINFDLYGCIQVAISPRIGVDGKLPDQAWVDVQRLSADDNAEPVIPLPDYLFAKQSQPQKEGQNGPAGAAEKPDFHKE